MTGDIDERSYIAAALGLTLRDETEDIETVECYALRYHSAPRILEIIKNSRDIEEEDRLMMVFQVGRLVAQGKLQEY